MTANDPRGYAPPGYYDPIDVGWFLRRPYDAVKPGDRDTVRRRILGLYLACREHRQAAMMHRARIARLGSPDPAWSPERVLYHRLDIAAEERQATRHDAAAAYTIEALNSIRAALRGE